jgi:hypothetical protein
VGIGTTSPTRQLTVVGSGPSGTVIEIRDQSSEQSWSEARLDMFAFDGIGGRLTMVSTTSGSRSLNLLANSPQTRITIDSQDKLGLYYDTFVELGPSSSDIKATLDDQGLFTLYNPSDVGTVEIIPNQSGGGLIGLENASGTRTVQLFGANSYGSEFEMRNVDGTRVFQVVAGASSGNRDALMTMSDAAGAQTVSIRSNSDTGANAGGGVFALRTENSVTTFKLEAQEDAATGQGSAMKFYNDSGVQTVEIDADYGNTNEGRVITDVLEITGGSDLSENFDVSSEGSELKPGTVVCIDPRNPGRLVVSRRSCDRTVAGVVSGAGGVRPGMLMGQHGSEANGKHPVALSGRVYVWCDASTGSIEPGDMLTTASTPGHAQRVDDFQKAQGAILGKAMSGLTDGRGLVLVLVTLQ